MGGALLLQPPQEVKKPAVSTKALGDHLLGQSRNIAKAASISDVPRIVKRDLMDNSISMMPSPEGATTPKMLTSLLKHANPVYRPAEEREEVVVSTANVVAEDPSASSAVGGDEDVDLAHRTRDNEIAPRDVAAGFDLPAMVDFSEARDVN